MDLLLESQGLRLRPIVVEREGTGGCSLEQLLDSHRGVAVRRLAGRAELGRRPSRLSSKSVLLQGSVRGGLVDGVGDVEVAPGGDGHPAVACIAGPRPHRAVVVVRAAAIPDHVHIMLV